MNNKILLKPLTAISWTFVTLVLTVLLSCNCISAQENNTERATSAADNVAENSSQTVLDKAASKEAEVITTAETIVKEDKSEDIGFVIKRKQENPRLEFINAKLQSIEIDNGAATTSKVPLEATTKNTSESKLKDIFLDDDNNAPDAVVGEKKFHWKPAIAQSLAFLAFQHGIRIGFQPRTRRYLGGPFFKDWFKSVKSLHGWNDGDEFYINYIGHPMQGSITNRIFLNNSDTAKKLEISKSKEYWKSQLKATTWSFLWSLQYEIGPVGEAAIGNLGTDPKDKHKMAMIDIVVTPVLGTAFAIGEDAVDKYFMKNYVERNTNNRVVIAVLRGFLAPTMTFANLLRLKKPWKRNDR